MGTANRTGMLTNKIETLTSINNSISIASSEMHRVADRATPPVWKVYTTMWRLQGYVGRPPTRGSHSSYSHSV